MKAKFKPREVIATVSLSYDYSEMLAEQEEEKGHRMLGDELREHLWELVQDSIGDSLRRLNEDHITIEINEQP
jgi:hypothetical protein